MKDHQEVWHDGDQVLSVPLNAQQEQYPAELITEIARLLLAFEQSGRYHLELTSAEGQHIRGSVGVEIGPALIEDHRVRLFFHCADGRRPTYELEPPDDVSVHKLRVFLLNAVEHQSDLPVLSSETVTELPVDSVSMGELLDEAAAEVVDQIDEAIAVKAGRYHELVARKHEVYNRLPEIEKAFLELAAEEERLKSEVREIDAEIVRDELAQAAVKALRDEP